jgi:3-phosphoshikimate 1-carboxyvinyltransferase
MILVAKSANPLRGEARLPGDKSISHRAALLASLAQGTSIFTNFLDAGVTRAMLNALSALGIAWTLDGERLEVTGNGLAGYRSPSQHLNCGNSATTMRLLAGALAAAGIPAVLDGSPGLRKRPMQRIVEPLQRMGAGIYAMGAGTPPLSISPRPPERPLRALDYRLPVASAQVKSCLLLAGLAAGGITRLHEPGPSRDHTERMLREMGVRISNRENEGKHPYSVELFPPSGQMLSPLHAAIPGDFSSAAFLITAALIVPGSEITLQGVGLNPTRTGLLDALQAMGAKIQIRKSGHQAGEPLGDLQVRHSRLSGGTVSGSLVVRMIDEFPIFAVAAAYAHGTTRVCQATELRHKESDRIASLVLELSKLGVQIEERADGFTIHGRGRVKGGSVDPHRDHRLAMALAVAGLVSQEPVAVENAAIIGESFPGFVPTLRKLNAVLDQVT